MRRQRLACSFLARRHIHWGLRLGHRLFRFQVFQLEFELLDLLVELFRLSPELHAPQLGQHQLQVLDLGGASRQFSSQICQLRFALFRIRFDSCGTRFAGQQHGFQGSDIVGQVGGVEHAPKFTRTVTGLQGRLRSPGAHASA